MCKQKCDWLEYQETNGRAAQVACRVRWDESPRSVQDENDNGDLCWTEACERIARRMFMLLEDGEAVKVSIREVVEQVLSPNESRIEKCCAHCEASKK